MTIWEILGIAPTKDISAIKKAYRAILSKTNPEDKPEEFMALRQSYEEASAWAAAEDDMPDAAEQAETEQDKEKYFSQLLPEDHPAYGWFRRLRALYHDFYKRINPQNWLSLSEDPLCTRIDTAGDVRNALLVFLMDYWFVPDSVIRLWDRTFHFEENKEELFENYPREFIEAVLLAPLTERVSLNTSFSGAAKRKTMINTSICITA